MILASTNGFGSIRPHDIIMRSHDKRSHDYTVDSPTVEATVGGGGNGYSICGYIVKGS